MTSAPVRAPAYTSRYHGCRMSEEQYLSLPEEKPYLEYVDGVVLQKTMPNSKHGKIAGELAFRLGAYRRRRGGAQAPEQRVRMKDGHYRLPDAAYWAAGRSSGDDSVPTLAVEIMSPDDSWEEQRAKCHAYCESGADVCWLLDPETRTAEVFEAGREGLLLPADGTLDSPALPGFVLALAELWTVLDD